MIRSILTTQTKLLRGMSYWRITLNSTKVISEDDYVFDLVRGRRPVDWAMDIVTTNDIRRIKEIALVTPHGSAAMKILEPYSAFQLKRGTAMTMADGKRIANAHVIGRVDNLETGECTATIWDVQQQKLYVDHLTNVRDFKAWRPGICDIGALALDVIGVRLK